MSTKMLMVDALNQADKALERRDREAYADWLRIFGCLWMSNEH